MANLTLGTAQIIKQANGAIFLRYMNQGSFLVGERSYSDINPALRFCRERGLRVIATTGFSA